MLDARFGLNAGFDDYDDRYGSRPAGGDLSSLERPADARCSTPRVRLDRVTGRRPARGSRGSPGCTSTIRTIPTIRPSHSRPRLPATLYGGEIAFADAAARRRARRPAASRPARSTRWSSSPPITASRSASTRSGRTACLPTTRRCACRCSLWAPPALQPGVLRGPSRLVDVMPTVLDLVGRAAVAGADGRSLWPFARAAQPVDDAGVYFEALNANLTRHWAPLTGLVSGGRKFIDLPMPELYDLAADPGERRNLYAAQPETAAPLAARGCSRCAPRPRRPRRRPSTRETERRLHSLGYCRRRAADARRGRCIGPQDDPKTLLAPAQQRSTMRSPRVKAGRTAEAERLLTALIAARPDFTVAYDRLAQLYPRHRPAARGGRDARSRVARRRRRRRIAGGARRLSAGSRQPAAIGRGARGGADAESRPRWRSTRSSGSPTRGWAASTQAHAMFAHMLSVAPNSATTLQQPRLALSEPSGAGTTPLEALTSAPWPSTRTGQRPQRARAWPARSRASSTGRSRSGGGRCSCGPI